MLERGDSTAFVGPLRTVEVDGSSPSWTPSGAACLHSPGAAAALRPRTLPAPTLSPAVAASVALTWLSSSGCAAVIPLDLRPSAGNLGYQVEDPAPVGDDGVARFFAVGDAGVRAGARDLGPSTQAVATLVERVCQERGGCDFGVFLGDNVYETGIADEDDRAFFDAFVGAYAKSGAKLLYFVLGNHDYHYVFPSSERAWAELDAIARLAPRGTRGRAHFFDFQAGAAHLFAWDTNYLVHRCSDWPGEQLDCHLTAPEMLGALSSSTAPFRIWLGHHPFVSNGEHGDAGDYLDAGLSLWRGEGLRRLMRRHLIGQADLLLSGHDHNLQAFLDGELRGTAAVVSGAGAKSTALRPPSQRNPAAFERDQAFGFALVEASASSLSVEIHAIDKNLEQPERVEAAFRMCKPYGGTWSVGSCL